MYDYTCFHIKGVENVWADLLGRWSAVKTVRRLVRVPELPSSTDPDFEWPTRNALTVPVSLMSFGAIRKVLSRFLTQLRTLKYDCVSLHIPV